MINPPTSLLPSPTSLGIFPPVSTPPPKPPPHLNGSHTPDSPTQRCDTKSPIQIVVPIDQRENKPFAEPEKKRRDDKALKSSLSKLKHVCTTCSINSKMTTLKNLDFGTLISDGDLKHILNSIFGLRLTKRELQQLKNYFDTDKGGDVDFLEFKDGFFKLVKKGRAEKERARLENDRRVRGRIERLEQEHKNKHYRDNSCHIDNDFSEKDKIKALRKIAKAATEYDQSRSVGVDELRVFDGCLTPQQFKEQLKKSFNVRLNPKELGCLLDRFDGDKDGTINGTEFLLEFCKIKNAAKLAMRVAKESEANALKAHYDKLGESYLERFAKVKQTKMNSDFKEGHYKRAMSKLEKVALFFDPERSNGLAGFQGMLDPSAFASQLKRCFR